jgi:hypothetical protein
MHRMAGASKPTVSLPCVRRARSTVALIFSRNQPYAGSTVQLRLQYALVSSDRSTRALACTGSRSGGAVREAGSATHCGLHGWRCSSNCCVDVLRPDAVW